MRKMLPPTAFQSTCNLFIRNWEAQMKLLRENPHWVYQSFLYNYSLVCHWHSVLQFFLYEHQVLFQVRYLYHLLITSSCLFFVMHTNHTIRHYSLAETYGAEMKVCSWALVTMHRKTVLYTWVREMSNENLDNWLNHLAFFHSLNSPTPFFTMELNPHKKCSMNLFIHKMFSSEFCHPEFIPLNVISVDALTSFLLPTSILSYNSITDEQARHTQTLNKSLILFSTK